MSSGATTLALRLRPLRLPDLPQDEIGLLEVRYVRSRVFAIEHRSYHDSTRARHEVTEFEAELLVDVDYVRNPGHVNKRSGKW
jgi:hypothetical protein